MGSLRIALGLLLLLLRVARLAGRQPFSQRLGVAVGATAVDDETRELHSMHCGTDSRAPCGTLRTLTTTSCSTLSTTSTIPSRSDCSTSSSRPQGSSSAADCSPASAPSQNAGPLLASSARTKASITGVGGIQRSCTDRILAVAPASQRTDHPTAWSSTRGDLNSSSHHQPEAKALSSVVLTRGLFFQFCYRNVYIRRPTGSFPPCDNSTEEQVPYLPVDVCWPKCNTGFSPRGPVSEC